MDKPSFPRATISSSNSSSATRTTPPLITWFLQSVLDLSAGDYEEVVIVAPRLPAGAFEDKEGILGLRGCFQNANNML